MVTLFFRITVLALLPFAVLCTRDYDPFADLTNARAHILSWSFSGKDTVGVYSTGTILIGVALREKVDSFSVSATHNRFWTDTTVRPATSRETYSFDVSFFDTGMQTVSVCTHRANGEAVTESFVIRTILPLRQSPVIGFFGDSLKLATPPVADKDVFYKWDFGGGRVAIAAVDSVRAAFFSGSTQDTGWLRVTDLTGAHATPAFAFSYTLSDTAKPVIVCMNDSLRGDTVVVRDSVLAFKAYICEFGDRSVDTSWVNQSSFDIANPRSHVYVELFKDFARHTRQNGPITITVHALDYKSANREAHRTFWAYFDPAGVASPEASVNFVVPSTDSSTTATRDFRIFGLAQNFRGDSMVLRAAVNDSALGQACVVTGLSGTWEWPAYLNSSVNKITVTAYTTGGRILTAASARVVYDPNAQDKVKPMLWEITADSMPAGNLHTSQTSVTLRVTAFDEGSGIQTLTINNAAASPDSSGYIWNKTIGLAHSHVGTVVTVTAVDRSQNIKDTTIVIYRNTKPLILAPPAIPPVWCVDSSISIRISCFDADSDTVKVIPLSKPLSMTVSADGEITWKPVASDTGFDSLVVQLYDGYDFTVPVAWHFACSDCSVPAAAVRFLTKEQDFPLVLQAGADTMSVRLATDPAANGQPLLFSAVLPDHNVHVLSNDTSHVLIWAPQAADTGYRKIVVTVGNGLVNFDTVTPLIRVAPHNHFPCSLSWTFTGDTTAAGELDLFTRKTAQALYFVIHDSDDISTESYTVNIAQRGVSLTQILNKRAFSLAVYPDSTRILDTIGVRVEDATGTTAGARLVVRYAASPIDPYAGWPNSRKLILNTTPSGANVAGTVHDFPVLVRLSAANFLFSQAGQNGDDIRFANQNGSVCPYDIERWDATHSVAEIWVKVDTVFGNDSSQYIMMYWGKAVATAANPTAVFDTARGFAGVWHLNEDPSLGQTIVDRTANHFNSFGQSEASMPSSIAGNIGPALYFSGAGTNIKVPRPVKDDFTFAFWMETLANGPTGTSWYQGTGLIDSYGGAGRSDFGLSFLNQRPTFGTCCPEGNLGATATVNDNAWHQVAVTRASSSGAKTIFVDGQAAGSAAGATGPLAGMDTVSIGKILSVPLGFYGVIDEIQASTVVRSADWIKLEYMNQKSVDALLLSR